MGCIWLCSREPPPPSIAPSPVPPSGSNRANKLLMS
uniref:SRT901 n=1 Tax=Arundo donax TaxID=35708 RepID=A0A0A8XP89_ARUDO